MTTPAVYTAIHAISAQLARDGISKTRRNQQQGYQFRGIDDVMNALSPLLVAHKLVIIPRCLSRECAERTTQKGGALYYATIHAEFDFVSAEDGSKHTAATFGEGMDSADKATNKAMSAAYKYAAFLTFCIPTEGDGDVDADATTPERTVYTPKPAPQPEPPAMSQAPTGKPSHIIAPAKDAKVLAVEKAAQARKAEESRKQESAALAEQFYKTLNERHGMVMAAGNKREVSEVQQLHNAWCETAKACWSKLGTTDQQRVKKARLRLEDALKTGEVREPAPAADAEKVRQRLQKFADEVAA